MQSCPISCFIIALNEADRIGATIRSVRHWVDEVIVVDSGSTDGTVARAEAEGARVIYNPWPGFGQQKRFAEDQCRNSWLLNLDADEVVTPQLAAEIAALFRDGGPEMAAYGMQVSIVYPGWQRPRIWGRDHYCLRLYDRRRVRFRDSTLHDSVVAGDEPVGHLRSVVYHHTIRSLAEFERKSDERATYQARHMGRKSPWGLRLRLLTELPASFLKYYVVRGHITGGWMGVKVAAIIAYYRWIRIVRMLRNRRQSGRLSGAVVDQLGS